MIYRALAIAITSLSALFSLAQAQDTAPLPILEGQTTTVSEFPYVAKVIANDGLCSGTLIAPKFVLSAAHCVTNYVGRVLPAHKVSIELNGATFSATNIYLHPSYNPNLACEEKRFDVALVELSSEVPDITPIKIATVPPNLGDQLLIVGFGSEGSGEGGQNGVVPSAGSVNFGLTYVEEVTPTYVNWVFDPGEANTGGGDSGGPAFTDLGGTRYLSSITCGGTSDAGYGTYSFNTRIDRVAVWIKDKINGFDAADPKGLKLKNASIMVDFTSPHLSYVRASGSFKLPSQLSPNGRRISIKIGEYVRTFRLDKFASAKSGPNFMRLHGKRDSRGRFIRNQRIRFKLEDGNSELTTSLYSLGFLSVGSSELTFPIAISVGKRSFSGTQLVQFDHSSRAWR